MTLKISDERLQVTFLVQLIKSILIVAFFKAKLDFKPHEVATVPPCGQKYVTFERPTVAEKDTDILQNSLLEGNMAL